MVTKRKGGQKKGYLGHRSHGRGNCKNRRGSGNRGGRGMAGIDKHKWSWAQVYDKDHFDKHGFVPPTKTVVKTVYLYELEQDARANKLEKKGGKFCFEFDGKVLANGSITHPVSIKASAWSKNVEEKLKAAGGDITKLEGKAPKAAAPAPKAAVPSK